MSRVPCRPSALCALVYLLLRLGRSRRCSFYTASMTELLYVAGTGSNKVDLVNQKNQTTHRTTSAVSKLYNFPLKFVWDVGKVHNEWLLWREADDCEQGFDSPGPALAAVWHGHRQVCSPLHACGGGWCWWQTGWKGCSSFVLPLHHPHPLLSPFPLNL